MGSFSRYVFWVITPTCIQDLPGGLAMGWMKWGRARFQGTLVAVLTFSSMLLILLVWLRFSQGTVFWVYSVSTTGFVVFMYLATMTYRPEPDSGFRPDITVVIPAKNEEGAIESVIRTVFNSDYPISKMEVIVVEDGSTDDTWERIQKAKADLGFPKRLATIKHDRNYGKRVALASAVTRARGEIIVCIDSDSFVDRDAVKLLVQPFRNSTVMAVSGHGEAVNKDEGILPRLQHYWYAETFRLMKGMESRLGCVSCCSGMLAAYRRSAIMPVVNEWLKEKSDWRPLIQLSAKPDEKKLDRGLWGKLIRSPGEDRILTAFALSTKNAKAVYQSNAVVYTIVPKTFKQFLKQQLRWNRAWMHGSLLSSTFMWKKPALSSFIFYLHQFITFLSPVVLVWWLVVEPLNGLWMGALGFVAGTLFVGFLHGMNTWKYLGSRVESIPYRMMFVFLSFFLTITVLVYGWATPWKMSWVTRTEKEPLPIVSPRVDPIPTVG
jgi:hyaluronan synthase